MASMFCGEQMLIAVPSTASAPQQVRAQAEAAWEQRADLFELRLDPMAEALWPEAIRSVAEVGIPVLLTLRSGVEGGAWAWDEESGDERYRAAVERILRLVAELPAAERGTLKALDVELARQMPTVLTLAHDLGLEVVLSSHDFDATPPADELMSRLAAIREAGADLAKIAVMPRDAADLDHVREAAAWTRAELGIPFVLIAMGELGMSTRIHAEELGSALTFATVSGEASAPGQIDIEELRALRAQRRA